MKPLKIIILAAVVLGLTACSATKPVSRNEPLVTQLVDPAPAISFNVQDLRISVPDSLSVSEANIYYPSADIVWRGDDYGERHQQVKAIFEDAMTQGLQGLHGNRAVIVDIEVKRFHSLTERARYTIGGVHSIKFVMTLHDAQTGALIGEPRLVVADLKGFGGKKAVAAEHRGVTQKVRIKAHLARVIQHELIARQTDKVVLESLAAATE